MAQQLTTHINVSDLFQVGIVVRDLEESMRRYRDLLGMTALAADKPNVGILVAGDLGSADPVPVNWVLSARNHIGGVSPEAFEAASNHRL